MRNKKSPNRHSLTKVISRQRRHLPKFKNGPKSSHHPNHRGSRCQRFFTGSLDRRRTEWLCVHSHSAVPTLPFICTVTPRTNRVLSPQTGGRLSSIGNERAFAVAVDARRSVFSASRIDNKQAGDRFVVGFSHLLESSVIID